MALVARANGAERSFSNAGAARACRGRLGILESLMTAKLIDDITGTRSN